MFGPQGVTAENKATAWQLMRCTAKAQMQVWQVFKAFPNATLNKVR